MGGEDKLGGEDKVGEHLLPVPLLKEYFLGTLIKECFLGTS